MHTTHYVTNAQIQTAYHEAGQGKALVLIHGFTGSKLDFHDELDRLEDLRRIIAYDQRGHGESSNLGPYSFSTLVADLIGFLDQVGVQQCDLLGHSLGGMVAIRAVLQHPHRFRSLILMDTAAEPLEVTAENSRELVNSVVREQGCGALLKMMRAQPASAAVQRGIDYLGEAEHWRRIRVKLSQMDADAFVALSAELEDYPALTDQLPAIACPTTVIVGQRDVPFIASSKSLVTAIPKARLESIPLAGHCPQYENADAWREAVRGHLTR
ncbi:MAG: alpha/beta hydrolase [Gammaproteobacteria bacterium]|nr:alpha/beta hydrolase [Gammaproteobacteria bacterium]